MSLDLNIIRARAQQYANAIGPGGEKAWLAGLLAADVTALLAEVERLAVYHDRYWAVEHVLNEALGPNEEDGTGEGVAADVALLAQQRDEARAALAAVEQAGAGSPVAALPRAQRERGRTPAPRALPHSATPPRTPVGRPGALVQRSWDGGRTAMTRPHTCPGRCGRGIPPRHLACRPCWWRLPQPWRDAVTSAYRDRAKNPLAHRQAVQAAIQWYRDNPRKESGQ